MHVIFQIFATMYFTHIFVINLLANSFVNQGYLDLERLLIILATAAAAIAVFCSLALS